MDDDPAVSVARGKYAADNRRLLEALTARLPQWFAQSESNRHYAEQAEVRRAHPLSLKLTRLGGAELLSGLVRALATLRLQVASGTQSTKTQ